MYEAARAYHAENNIPLPEKASWSWFYDLVKDKQAGPMAPFFRFSVAYLRKHRERLRLNDPPNGWGCVDSCADWLDRIAAACEQNPEGILSGSA